MALNLPQFAVLRRMRDGSKVQLHAGTARALERRGLITVTTTLTPLGSARPTRITWGRITERGEQLLKETT